MSRSDLQTFKQHFSGDIIAPEDANYKEASMTLMGKGAPVAIVRPKTVDDVAAAIAFARDNSLVLSVRSGGHSGAGFSTNTGGLVIDLMYFNTVEVIDSEKNIVRIGAGARWGEVAKTLAAHDLTISSGDTTSVGVGGLTLGGGVGWMVRKYGLTIDSVVGAQVVLADGSVIRTSDTEHPDLFWALRGGGGNFGVVLYFEFAAHPVGDIFSGTITYGQDNLRELLINLRDYMRTADEALTVIASIIPAFGEATSSVVHVTCCYASDDEARAQKAIEPLRHLGDVLQDDVKRKKYFEILEEAHVLPGVKIVVNNIFAEKFSDELIDAVVQAKTAAPNIIMQIRSLGGAMSRVASDATAFPYRKSEVMILSPLFLAPTVTPADEEKALKPWSMIAKFSNGGYIGFFTNPRESLETMYPRATQDRLAMVKKEYDPHNLFNQNYNIKPV